MLASNLKNSDTQNIHKTRRANIKVEAKRDAPHKESC